MSTTMPEVKIRAHTILEIDKYSLLLFTCVYLQPGRAVVKGKYVSEPLEVAATDWPTWARLVLERVQVGRTRKKKSRPPKPTQQMMPRGISPPCGCTTPDCRPGRDMLGERPTHFKILIHPDKTLTHGDGDTWGCGALLDA